MQERTNREWLRDLRGPHREEAIADLRTLLVRGLSYSLSQRGHGDINVLIEDFVQEALLKILDNLDTFRGESKFITWAQKIAVRVAYSEFRRKRWEDISIQALVPDDSGIDFTPEALTDPGANPEQSTTQTRIFERVLTLIEEELTERQRRALLAVMAENMPLEEVARRMDTNRNALYKVIYDARKNLKQHLLAEGLTPESILASFDTDSR